MAPSLRATEEVDGEGSGWIDFYLKSRPGSRSESREAGEEGPRGRGKGTRDWHRVV